MHLCWDENKISRHQIGSSMSRYISITALIAMLFTASGCDNFDNRRIPARNIRIEINTAQWSVYGVHSYMEWKTFIRNISPKGYVWKAGNYAGYGGVLLVCGLENQLLAYDMACPVECAENIRITVDETAGIAICPKCGSTYDVFNGFGQPLSGSAYEKKYGLTTYLVMPTSSGYVITR